MELECPDGWKLVSLRELGEVNRGRSRHRPRYAEHLYSGPYPFIQTGDVKASNGRVTSHTQSYSESGLAQSRLWPAGTMCITIAANIAETGILTFPACFPDSVVGFIAEPKKADVQFVEYMFRFMRSRIQHQATGSVQDNINIETLERLHFPIPPLAEQKRIAGILGALDDKIELNRKMNETLEQMARALFKSWFVDFDPVHAKAAGRHPSGMDKATADLFPDSFVDSELGKIPKGWNTALLGDEVNITRGCSYKSEELASSTTAMVTLKSFKRGGGYRQDGLKSYTGSYKTTQIVRQGDLVVSYTDVTQAAELIGRPAIIGSTENFRQLVISQDVAVVRPNDGMPISYLFRLMMEESFRAHTYAHSTGTTVLHLGREALPTYKFAKPNRGVLAAFDQITTNLLKLANDNDKQSRILSSIRDALLPKLLSGELNAEIA